MGSLADALVVAVLFPLMILMVMMMMEGNKKKRLMIKCKQKCRILFSLWICWNVKIKRTQNFKFSIKFLFPFCSFTLLYLNGFFVFSLIFFLLFFWITSASFDLDVKKFFRYPYHSVFRDFLSLPCQKYAQNEFGASLIRDEQSVKFGGTRQSLTYPRLVERTEIVTETERAMCGIKYSTSTIIFNAHSICFNFATC